MKIIVICSWCKRCIKFKDFPGDKPPKLPISHGICLDCKRKLEEETERILKERQEHIYQRKGGHHETQYQTGIG